MEFSSHRRANSRYRELHLKLFEAGIQSRHRKRGSSGIQRAGIFDELKRTSRARGLIPFLFARGKVFLIVASRAGGSSGSRENFVESKAAVECAGNRQRLGIETDRGI